MNTVQRRSILSKSTIRLLMIVLVILIVSAVVFNPNANALVSGRGWAPATLPAAAPFENGANASVAVTQVPTTREIIVEWIKTQAGQDRFYPDFIVVNQGDTVNLTFINNDTVAHNFVIGAPYNIMVNASVPGLHNDLTGQEFTTPALHNSPGVKVTGTPGNVSASYSFVARYPGIFEYVCTYHIQVGMIGYLVVLPNAAASNSGSTQPNPTSQTELQSPSTAQVGIDAGSGIDVNSPGYSPVNITVVVGVNNTVTWTNDDNMPHTVTAVDGSFDSRNLDHGQTFAHTFTKPGSYVYTCTYHPWMQGTVTVLPQVSSPQSQGYGNFAVVLTGHEIYAIVAFGVVVLAALMVAFARSERKNESS